MLRFLRRFIRDIEGTALIEATLVTPFLLLLSGGVIEFSNFFFRHHEMTTGVRDAARYLAKTNNWAASQTAAQNLATRGDIAGTGTLRVPGWTSITVTPSTIANPMVGGSWSYHGVCTVGGSVTILMVSASVPYAPVMFPGGSFAAFFGFTSPVMQVS